MLCGKWFDLTDYDNKDEFYEAIQEMFKEFDKTHPLDFNQPREESMFNDWENIPKDFIGESWISDNFWEYMEVIEGKGWNEEEVKFALDCVDNYDLSDSNTNIKEIFEDVYITACDKYDLSLHYLINYLGLDPESANKVHGVVDDDYCIKQIGYGGGIVVENGSTYLTNECVEV
jgi:hypothetical protein